MFQNRRDYGADLRRLLGGPEFCDRADTRFRPGLDSQAVPVDTKTEMNVPPLLGNDAPPALPPQPKPGSGRRLLAIVLSLCLGLFLADAAISLMDDLLILMFHSHPLTTLSGLITIATLLMGAALYGLIGFTPMVPKRFFLPLPFFILGAILAVLPLMTYYYGHFEAIDLGVSASQLALGMFIWYRAQGSLKLRRPAITAEQLGARWFSWTHVSIFALLNLFVLLPLVTIYVFASSAGAVKHFSEGFMTLHPSGFTVQARKYVREDGKVIELFPMAHVAEADFYQNVSRAFPTNSIILMEGVTDDGNLLTNKITYKRMARTLGLAEQKQTFVPSANHHAVSADVDVGQFSKETLDFLNLVMMIHSKGATMENVMKLMQWSPSPDFDKQLFDDILVKRNEHLLQEIQSHLQKSDSLMVPWGVAHMPGIAREIQKSGFHLAETHEYFVIRFGHGRDKQKSRQ